MLITRVELQNVKSYRDEIVVFTEGTNAICGENGAGKSTLLEAIGFALFDFLPYTQSDFVREGEKTATVAVSFISSEDGREYQAVRRWGSSSDYYIYDPELDGRLVTGKSDVLDWLREHMGVEPNTDLTALFRDAVGVPQGLLTAPFLQRPSERKPLFDRLLRVDEYEQAWKDLRETVRYLDDRLAGHRERIAGLEAQVVRLPALRERTETLRADLAGIETRLAQLLIELKEATVQREALDATKKEIDHLSKTVEVLTVRLEGIGAQLEVAERAVAEAEAAQAIVEASRPGYEAYQEAQAALAALENDRVRRDKLQAEYASMEKSLALARERVKRLEEDLVEIEEAEARMQGLRPEVERQAEWEAALETARNQMRSLELAEHSLAERQRGLSDLQVRLERVQAGLAEAVRLEAVLRDHRAHLEQAGERLADLRSEQAAVKTEMERLAEQTRVLEASAESPEDQAIPCPVCEQPLTGEHRADLLERNRGQLGELEACDRSLAEAISQIKEKSSLLEQELRELEAQLRGLPRAAEGEELAAQIAALEGELSELQAEIDALADSRDEASRLEGALAGLGDPRRDYERLAERAEGRPDLEEKLEAERHAASALEASLGEVERALAGFADLDGRLAETRGALDRYERDYRGYLENTKLTADLPARREQAEALRAQQAGLAAERDDIRAQAGEIARRFDPETLEAARRREAGLLAERAGLEGQAQGLRGQVAQAAREIDELEAAERALAAQQAEQTRDQQLLSLTGFIRDVIRQAGPHVTRRLMQQVSLEAARLFAEVMADHTARLRWDDNYEIVLEQNGRDRGFPQLSGGEQMAAALAVRLALLRELSAIDIAFFDEPTSNLDDTRRDSLAEQILSVKGFSQLFVISHDDTFERVTHHVVRVRKEDGASRVEAQ